MSSKMDRTYTAQEWQEAAELYTSALRENAVWKDRVASLSSGKLAQWFEDIKHSWDAIPWTGVGNDLTGRADRSDIREIDVTIEEALSLPSVQQALEARK